MNAIAARVPRNGHPTAWSTNAGARNRNAVPMFQQDEATLQPLVKMYISKACVRWQAGSWVAG